MSAIGGVFSRTGVPLDPAVFQRLDAALEDAGPDGGHTVTTPSVGMVWRAFHTDADSRRGGQPHVGDDGLMVACDGRLDNRDTLARALAHDLQYDASTPAVIAAAYRRWTLLAFPRLIGDFALALWDPRRRRLVLACDALGVRRLYYHVDDERLVWASRARALLEAVPLPSRIDADHIAAFLTGGPSSHGPFVGVEALAGAHMLVVEPHARTLRRYWCFDPAREVRHASDADYEEHFREVFEKAVACRLSADAPVVAPLTSGLGAASVACTASRLVAAGFVRGADLLTADLADAADSSGLPRRLPRDLHPDLPADAALALSPWADLGQRMAQAGARVLLSGTPGDEVFGADEDEGALPLADLLVEGRPIALVRAARAWSRRRETPYLQALWRGAVRPLGEWISADLLRHTGLGESCACPEGKGSFRLPSQALQHARIRRALRGFALEPCARGGRFEVRSPYLDRRVLELALALPLEQKVRPGEPASIVRRALRDVLPAPARVRPSAEARRAPREDVFARARPWLAELFADSRAADLGFINPQLLLEALQPTSRVAPAFATQVRRTLGLELWLRSVGA
jgi:asparagine synthase (glutamine-hydrolysing)